MRRIVVFGVLAAFALAIAGCVHHRHNSPVKKFLKKRHKVHTGQTGSN